MGRRRIWSFASCWRRRDSAGRGSADFPAVSHDPANRKWSEWGGGASWCCPSLSTSFALMVKECRRPRRKRKTPQPSAAVLHVSHPSFVQNRLWPTGSWSVEEVVGSTLTHVCPMCGLLFSNLLTAAGQTHRPRWEKEKTTTSVSWIYNEIVNFWFIPFFFFLFSRWPAGRLCVYHVTLMSCWIHQQLTPIVVFQVHSGKGSNLIELELQQLWTAHVMPSGAFSFSSFCFWINF